MDQRPDQTRLSSPKLQVLPQGQHRQQKVAVGDSAGVVQCVSVKKGEVTAAFKTLPTGQKVSHVTLGKGQPIQRDKIYVAQGQAVSVSLQGTAGLIWGNTQLTTCVVGMLGAGFHQEGQAVLQL